MLTLLFTDRPQRWPKFEAPLRAALDAACIGPYRLSDSADPAEVDYIIFSPSGGLRDFTPFTNLKAVLSLWAGVESIVGNDTLRVPLTRMVDQGLSEGMVEWVTGHVLRHHLGMDQHILEQDGVWRGHVTPPLARDRQVAILGLGALGQACAKMLVALNFQVLGWSRGPKSIPGVSCFHGEDGLREVLAGAEICVLLLPNTPHTEDTLDAAALRLMPQGAVILNPGRGPLIDDDALLESLNSGHIGHATLDVFRQEPLPPEHPFWSHPRITVTPHIAAETRAATTATVIAENIRRNEAGEPMRFLVDRDLQY
ncbi:MAG: glyoxylate/hydroxypyruvate reductase A [Pseudomonadota bacterium]